MISSDLATRSSKSVEKVDVELCNRLLIMPEWSFLLQSEFLVCGGGPEGSLQSKTCLTLTAEGWVKTHDLHHERVKHISWTTDQGTVLIGGFMSQSTTEIVKQPGLVELSFELKNPA